MEGRTDMGNAHHGMTRRSLLTGATAVAAAAATGTPALAAPSPGGQVPTLWREFTRTPFTHPQIPYVGRAGYRGGAAHFPRRPASAAVSPGAAEVDVRDYGAVPDGRTDSAPAINRAIAAAGRAGGGTVTVPPGTFRIGDVIRIGHDNVVLRGAGSGRTTLYATKNLTELIGVYGSRYGGTKSSWSWAGGLIWLAPKARWDSLVAAIRAQAWPFEGWTGNRRDEWQTLTAVEPARQGSWTVRVANPAPLRPGTLVLLRLSDDPAHTLLQHMAGGGPGPAAYYWEDKTKLLSYVPYEWPVRIARVRGCTVTLQRPLPLDLRPEWSPQFTTHIRELTGSAVEGLTLRMIPTPQSPHLLDKGYNGVVLQCAYDCWVDDVTVRDVDNGFGLVAASSCTLRRTRVGGRGEHHPYFCREGSHDNLIEDFTIEQRTVPAPADTQLHGINVEGLSSYNVWSRGDMRMGTFDSHRGLPFANVRTDITVDNNGRHGGDASAGPLFGARFAHWNIRVTNGRAGLVKLDGLAPYSATVGVDEVTEFDQIDVPDFPGDLHTRLELYPTTNTIRPSNLYDAQRRL
ncbi:glycosyl hydrolase family 28-related protein [Streptomyces sp. NBC_00474]|uniref:glycosyl hydrolase family 28-related protein n=1 Tax=Streptomyces sp. NBC_00474 TaxID=2975754 RepID=UPI002256C287|nr:glycosyl hydrolase family 28-related protein [Streptomyces sp. NBC_00474]MCX5049141.1 glycoside hydrolase family 55 protein [Streptomyces sp. NBC_00474]